MKDDNLPEYYRSIFHPLFKHAKDLGCKIILLEQILEVGDAKEIPFLEELERNEETPISKLATEVKTALLDKLGRPASKESKRLPMNLCFLYDEFSIKPAKTEGLNMNFDVTLEIFEEE
ncbi:hypothetical protein FVB32_14405 [Flagellimonas hymeniacidonis]|uniref:Uncharacterized protein n=1 Tax=Flagellimonas hymeniacidonis TaxID=2603628 RepID=A0A5C8V2E4_9FLAO|nr:hypothetical protein [Flagellimonas hymeniacidonis]TXN35760.1 hypothetical protein FVB32_14405 [Flagellimonas hymeniacidonis]